MQLQDKRLRDQVKHDMDIADLEMQIQKIREESEDKKTAQERARALEQKKRDLDAARRQATQPLQQGSQKTAQATRPPPSTTASASGNNGNVPRQPGTDGRTTSNTSSAVSIPTALNKSPSELEWERQKRVDGASNGAIDELMLLTGLEDVKMKMLDIKAKIETVARQGIDMKKERMGMVMLGNPGTGMLH
jgi:DNA repair exonuclease SbcCD ATPase subunit